MRTPRATPGGEQRLLELHRLTSREHRRPLLLATLVGLGPLVRPDLFPFAVCFLVALVVIVGFQALFLRMIWTTPAANRHLGLDPGSTFFTEADQDQRDAGSHPA